MITLTLKFFEGGNDRKVEAQVCPKIGQRFIIKNVDFLVQEIVRQGKEVQVWLVKELT